MEAKQIFNPGILSGDLLSQEFCGSCHRSVDEVFAMPQRGEINNLRFQPYRIFKSKCYQDDRRVSCIACHDPHAELISNPAFYDSKCLSCHLSSRKPGRMRDFWMRGLQRLAKVPSAMCFGSVPHPCATRLDETRQLKC